GREADRGADAPRSPFQELHAEGWAMLAAALGDFLRVPGVEAITLLDEGLRAEPAVAEAVGRWPASTVRWVRAADEERAFRTAADEADWSLVIAPELDRILETRCRWVADAGGRLLGPTPDAVALTADKLALSQFLDVAGVPTPRCLRIDSLNKD